MLRFFLVTLMLFASLEAFSKTVLMPRDFLNPVVRSKTSSGDSQWSLLETMGNYYYGARSPERAIRVILNESIDLEELEFEVLLTGNNRGPWMNFVNTSIYQDDKYIGFAPTGSSIVGSQSSGKAAVRFSFKEICDHLSCNFNEGVLVYLYLDPKLNREIRPIYKWDHVLGSYYLFKYKRH